MSCPTVAALATPKTTTDALLTMDILITLVSWPVALAGIVFMVAGAIGVVRLPDLYTRLHAASVTDTGATLLIGLVLLFHAVFVFGSAMAAIKMVLIVGFTLFTAPTASHVLAKTALLTGLVPLGRDGRGLLASSEEATQLARSRPDANDTTEES